MAIHVPDDAEIEFEEEPVTYTAIHDWVPLTPGLSDAAVRYYHVLRMHVNRSRGDNQVKATTLTLARMMGRTRGDKTAPWLAELVAIGAVKVSRRGIPSRYVYKIEQEPPTDWAGPVNIRQWYDAHREELAQARVAAKAKRDARKATKLQVEPSNPDVGATEGQTPVTPMSGLLVPPMSGLQVAPTSGREPNGFEPNEFQPPPPTVKEAAPAADTPNLGGGGGASPNPQPDPDHLVAARAVLTAAYATSGQPLPPVGMLERLAVQLAPRLAAGWSSSDAADHLAGAMAGGRTPYAIMKWRIDHNLAGPPPPPRPAPEKPAPAQRRPPCGTCSGDGTVPADPVVREFAGRARQVVRYVPCPDCAEEVAA